jgi:hypothetical protein
MKPKDLPRIIPWKGEWFAQKCPECGVSKGRKCISLGGKVSLDSLLRWPHDNRFYLTSTEKQKWLSYVAIFGLTEDSNANTNKERRRAN